MQATQPSSNVRSFAYLGGISGLALFTALITYQGVRDVAAVLAGAGWGLAVITAFHLTTVGAHAIAWRRLLPESDRERVAVPTLFWARWIAESINDLLPVLQIGGNLVRAFLAQRGGMRGSVAGASVIVDVTTNVFAQLAFTLLGLCLLVFQVRHGATAAPVVFGTVIMSAMMTGFYLVQRQGIFAWLARRIERLSWTPEWTVLSANAEALDSAVGKLYGDRAAIASAGAWHLAGWLLGAVEIWLAMMFLGHPLSLLAVVLMEALAEAVRTAAFAVPGALGVQEAGYVVVGGWLGLTPDVALALSLAKRVREVVLGVPGLIAWQLQGVTSVLGRKRAMEGEG